MNDSPNGSVTKTTAVWSKTNPDDFRSTKQTCFSYKKNAAGNKAVRPRCLSPAKDGCLQATNAPLSQNTFTSTR